MIKRFTLRRTLAAGAVVGVAAVGAGVQLASKPNPNIVQGKVLNVISELPMQGAQSGTTGDLLKGEKLALAQARGTAAGFTVRLKTLDDATTALGSYDLGQCLSNGNAEAADPRAIAVIGTFNSGCAEQAIPILDQAGIGMISPANTYLGLTRSVSGATLKGEPGVYYPSGKRNYVRIVPNDGVQADALLQAIKNSGVRKVALATDGSAYGNGLARLMNLDKATFGVDVVSITQVNPAAATYRPYAEKIARQGADGFVYLGYTASGGDKIMRDVAEVLPKARLFGPDGMCASSWANPAEGGLPLSDDPRMECTIGTLNMKSYPGGAAFMSAYKAAYGAQTPDPYAIYGYEAMKLTLDTLDKLGGQANNRAAFIDALFNTKNRKSVLGTYSIDKNGDTTNKTYGLYKVHGGKLRFAQAITPRTVG